MSNPRKDETLRGDWPPGALARLIQRGIGSMHHAGAEGEPILERHTAFPRALRATFGWARFSCRGTTAAR